MDHSIDIITIPVIFEVESSFFDQLFSKNKKYASLFCMQLIDPSFPCIPLHITPHKTGFALENSTCATVTTIAVCFVQKNFMIRCLNSAMAAIYCLITFPNIGLDRLENQDDEIIDLTDIE